MKVIRKGLHAGAIAIEKVLGDIFATPQPVLERARDLLGVKNR